MGYYATENERRRAFAAERRKIRARTAQAGAVAGRRIVWKHGPSASGGYCTE